MTVQQSVMSLPAVLSLTKNDRFASYLVALNIHIDHWQLLIRDDVWLPVDKAKVEAVLRQIAFGSCDILGVPRPTHLPAEYVACVVACLVSPVNWMSAAVMWSMSPATVDLIDGDDNKGNILPVGSGRMFALVMQYAAMVSPEDFALIKRNLQIAYQSGLAPSERSSGVSQDKKK